MRTPGKRLSKMLCSWTKSRLEIDACKEHFCVNDAKCIDDGIGGYSCECEPDYAGDYCESPKPCYPRCYPCFMDTVKCANNSTCWPGNPNNTKDEDDYKCICRPGYIGKYCEDELPCAITNPCKNGGECYRENGKAVCECLSIWTGDFCENFNICYDRKSKCHGGVCQAVNETNYKCNCFDSYMGEFCEIPINFCEPNPCLNKI
ncbi:hypothetical protein L596_026074 [Steinernema carpocapsae]|uniref:EGF-like domain-containing protein n=1 Tax=Steinernema carpocapsae TaxID=34508 RepID=A0A4U5M0C4_STECR|nr:hypothetical protein L596_026074 [Steinernema carpocapsae]